MRRSVSKGQGLSEGFARREGKGGTWVEGNGAHVHVTVNMGLELLVEFGVKVGG